MPKTVNEALKESYKKHFVDFKGLSLSFKSEEEVNKAKGIMNILTDESPSKDEKFNKIKDSFKVLSEEINKPESDILKVNDKVRDLKSKLNDYFDDKEFMTTAEYRGAMHLNNEIKSFERETGLLGRINHQMNSIKEIDKIKISDKIPDEANAKSFTTNLFKETNEHISYYKTGNDEILEELIGKTKKNYKNMYQEKRLVQEKEKFLKEYDNNLEERKALNKIYAAVNKEIEGKEFFNKDAQAEREKLQQKKETAKGQSIKFSDEIEKYRVKRQQIFSAPPFNKYKELISLTAAADKEDIKVSDYQKRDNILYKLLKKNLNQEQIDIVNKELNGYLRTLKRAEGNLLQEYYEANDTYDNKENKFYENVTREVERLKKSEKYYGYDRDSVKDKELIKEELEQSKIDYKKGLSSTDFYKDKYNSIIDAKNSFYDEYISRKNEYEANDKALNEKINFLEKQRKNYTDEIKKMNVNLFSDKIREWSDKLKQVKTRTFAANSDEFQSMYDKTMSLKDKLSNNPDYKYSGQFMTEVNELMESAQKYSQAKKESKRSTSVGQARMDVALDIQSTISNSKEIADEIKDIKMADIDGMIKNLKDKKAECDQKFGSYCKYMNDCMDIYYSKDHINETTIEHLQDLKEGNERDRKKFENLSFQEEERKAEMQVDTNMENLRDKMLVHMDNKSDPAYDFYSQNGFNADKASKDFVQAKLNELSDLEAECFLEPIKEKTSFKEMSKINDFGKTSIQSHNIEKNKTFERK